MFSKIILVLTTLCVVNASVISVNVFDDDPETEAASNPKDCNIRACDQLCRRLKFSGGFCVNDRCKCDNFLNAEDDISEKTLSDLVDLVSLKEDDPNNELPTLSNLEDSVSPRKCNHQECNAQCRRLLFREGVCITGRCSCNNYIPIPKETLNDLEESISLDNKFLGTEVDFSDESLPIFELSEDQTERECNMQACDQLCRRLKFAGGACVNGRCKCDNFFGTEDYVDEYSELDTRRICNLRQCNRTCTRRGYEGARCVNGLCKCYNKIQRQDTSQLNDVTSDEKEESNVMLRKNEEELIEPLSRACNILTCTQMCYRLKYDVGWCRFGKCQCYKN